MEKETSRGQSVKGLSQFLLLALFAALAVLLAAVCVRFCRQTEDAAAENAALRTPLSYVAGKLRAGDRAGAVSVESRDGVTVLVLAEDHGGDVYNTYIYYDNGAVREYFSRAAYGFDREYGTAVAEAAGFAVSLAAGVATLTVTEASGTARSLRICLRAGEGEA